MPPSSLQPSASRRPPLVLLVPALVAALLMVIPLVYLVVRASQASWAELPQLVFRPKNAELLWATLKLVLGVLGFGTLLAFPLAWLVTRTDLRGRWFWTILSVVPLAIPGYVMAYALLGLGGYSGVLSKLFGVTVPLIQGYWGAALALSLYTYPYLFLNLRAALLGLDASLEESAASLGYSRLAIFWRVTVPHLLPALLSGAVVVALYVLGDFGTVALMRYETFSYAIFTQYSGAFDRVYAAWLSLILLALALSFTALERFVFARRLARVGKGQERRQSQIPLGRMAPLAWLFMLLAFGVSLGVPLFLLGYWLLSVPPTLAQLAELPQTFLRSAVVALPVALLAAALAFPLSYLPIRYPSRLTRWLERAPYVGYALPPVTLALAMAFFALQTAIVLYQTLALLMLALTLTTLLLAIGPLRSALLQLPANIEEAAHALGYSHARTFWYVLLPRLRGSLLTSMTLVFLYALKELPITLMLAPTGYKTLSMTVFGFTVEGQLPQAAPFALAVIAFSGLSVALMLGHQRLGEKSAD